jgi:hypothetical protein
VTTCYTGRKTIEGSLPSAAPTSASVASNIVASFPRSWEGRMQPLKTAAACWH